MSGLAMSQLCQASLAFAALPLLCRFSAVLAGAVVVVVAVGCALLASFGVSIRIIVIRGYWSYLKFRLHNSCLDPEVSSSCGSLQLAFMCYNY